MASGNRTSEPNRIARAHPGESTEIASQARDHNARHAGKALLVGVVVVGTMPVPSAQMRWWESFARRGARRTRAHLDGATAGTRPPAKTSVPQAITFPHAAGLAPPKLRRPAALTRAPTRPCNGLQRLTASTCNVERCGKHLRTIGMEERSNGMVHCGKLATRAGPRPSLLALWPDKRAVGTHPPAGTETTCIRPALRIYLKPRSQYPQQRPAQDHARCGRTTACACRVGGFLPTDRDSPDWWTQYRQNIVRPD